MPTPAGRSSRRCPRAILVIAEPTVVLVVCQADILPALTACLPKPKKQCPPTHEFNLPIRSTSVTATGQEEAERQEAPTWPLNAASFSLNPHS